MLNKLLRRTDESGQGIAYVLVISTVILVFLIALVDVIRNEARFIVRQTQGTRLVHAEDGAADRAMYALLKGGNWDALPAGTVPGYQQDAVYTDVPGMKYTLKVQEGNWTPGYMIGDQDNERTITVFCTQTVTGTQPGSGQHRKLQVVVLRSTLNSALFAGGVIDIGGSATVHWGPVVSYNTGTNCFPGFGGTIPAIPVYLAAGNILIGGQFATAAGKDSSTPKASLSVDEKSTSIGTMPVVPLDIYKAAAQALEQANPGAGYYTTGSGSQALNNKSMPTTTPKSVIFFDTVDAKAWDGGIFNAATGNGVEVNKTSNMNGQGTLVVMGNLNVVGGGNGDPLMIAPTDCLGLYDQSPAGCVDTHDGSGKIFWDGFVYVANAISGAGDVHVYGSIYARDTAGLKGNVEIWYKSVDNQLGLLGKTLAVKIWRPCPPKAGDVFPP